MAVSRVPYPLEKGDKLRAFHQLRHLAQRHEVALFAVSDAPLHPDARAVLAEHCAEVEIVPFSRAQAGWNVARGLATGRPAQVGYFHFRRAQRAFDGLVERFAPDHLYCQLIRTAPYARPHPGIPKTIDYMDAFSKGLDRRLETASLHMRPPIALERRRVIAYERDAFDRFDHHTIISEQDRDLIPHPRRAEIEVIPNGVDFDFFRPVEAEKRFDLLFNGNMGYPPNVEAVEFLVGEVMPLVRERRPATTLLISGATPAPRVQALASDTVTVSGWVDDVRDSYASARVLVAPMLISIGLQNKLLEAMAMRMPCVTSLLANNALRAEPGREVLTADQPRQYADHIVTLLDDQARAREVAAAGYEFVRRAYDWESTTARLERLMTGPRARDSAAAGAA
jgi:sugar transferase (PEP-CTERM/EpsH1 system associated)